jgi:integrase
MKNDDMKSMGKSLEVFDKFLKADATKKLYLRLFTDFLKWTRENIDDSLNADDLLQFDEKKLQGMIENYILHIRKRLSPNSLPSNIAALEHYFAMNDKDIQFKRIRKMIPPPNKKGGNSAWTTKDIQKMIRNSSSNRDRAFIHFLASTGCRIGSLEGLKLRHILPMDDCRSVLIYEGSNEEYWAFLTPEACNAVDEYLEERRRDGEIINSESTVFRSAYQVGSQIVKPMSIAAAKMISLRLAHTVQRIQRQEKYIGTVAHLLSPPNNTQKGIAVDIAGKRILM